MWTTAVALTLLGAAAGQDDQEPAKVTAEDVRLAFVELQDAYDEARQDYYDAMRASWEAYQEQDDKSRPWEGPPAVEPDFYPRFAELADLGSADANLWCVQNHGASGLKGAPGRADKSKRLLELLSEDRGDEMLVSIARALSMDAQNEPGDRNTWLGRDAAFRFFDVIDRSTESDEVRVVTLYSRGSALAPYGATAEQARAAAKYYEEAAEKYPDTEMGQRCKGLAFAAKNLQIGQKAPDIVGKDHDGNDLKLSDFAGKVAVIDFWGFW